MNLDAAFNNFFASCKRGDKSGKRFPRFKSRKRGNTAGIKYYGYRVEEDAVNVAGVGRIKLKEKGYLPIGRQKISTSPKMFGLTITERADRWFVSVATEQDIVVPQVEARPVIGVDLGIKSLATISDGRVFANSKTASRYARKLRRAQKTLSRRQKGSANRDKARKIVAKLHYRIACIRGDAIHKMTNAITREPSVIVLENLNVSGMAKNRNLAKAVLDAGMYEIRRQIEYKAKWRGCEVVVADRFYPSSKTCSCCGWIDLGQTLDNRIFVCRSCGHTQDRDLNAAHNLAKLAASYAESLNACGGESSGLTSVIPALPDESGIQEIEITAARRWRQRARAMVQVLERGREGAGT